MSQDNEINSEELVTQVYKGHERRMYPEVAQYLRTFRNAQRAYEDATAKAEFDFRQGQRAMRRTAEDAGRSFDTYRHPEDSRAERELGIARQRAYTVAQDELDRAQQGNIEPLIDSRHPEVAWIARTILRDHADNGEQTEYARDILAILPATTEQIWQEAKDNRGMCDVFDRYYDQAEAAGIFNDGKAAVAAREIAALRNYIRRNYGGSYVGTFMEKLSPILKAYQEDYTAKLEAAKAEWQGLDEAWRSERSRRAAATRAANREAREIPEPHPAAQAANREAPAERTAEQEAQRLERSVISAQSAISEAGLETETPKVSTQDDFALANSN